MNRVRERERVAANAREAAGGRETERERETERGRREEGARGQRSAGAAAAAVARLDAREKRTEGKREKERVHSLLRHTHREADRQPASRAEGESETQEPFDCSSIKVDACVRVCPRAHVRLTPPLVSLLSTPVSLCLPRRRQCVRKILCSSESAHLPRISLAPLHSPAAAASPTASSSLVSLRQTCNKEHTQPLLT